MTGALKGIRVFDLSRILAGPSCTQILGDLGADIIKVEQPGRGDDTRNWGPPYLKKSDGSDSSEAAYYLGTNRNKRSLTLDIATAEGQSLARRLIGISDIFLENYKVDGLKKYGLSYNDLKDEFPQLIYCSITGFGQTGPYAPRAGYDYLIQGMSGLMSVTGEADGDPMKVGVPVSDLITGMYATVAILSALHHRTQTSEGQYIDMALLDSQLSWLYNQGMNYLVGGLIPHRKGNIHPNVGPCQAYRTSNGNINLIIGNNDQFLKFCTVAGIPKVAKDARFTENSGRMENLEALNEILEPIMAARTTEDWLETLDTVKVGAAPINTVEEILNDPQVESRGMQIALPHEAAGDQMLKMIASPIKMSKTPTEYRYPPPMLGQHTEEVLRDLLDLSREQIKKLRDRKVV